MKTQNDKYGWYWVSLPALAEEKGVSLAFLVAKIRDSERQQVGDSFIPAMRGEQSVDLREVSGEDCVVPIGVIRRLRFSKK